MAVAREGWGGVGCKRYCGDSNGGVQDSGYGGQQMIGRRPIHSGLGGQYSCKISRANIILYYYQCLLADDNGNEMLVRLTTIYGREHHHPQADYNTRSKEETVRAKNG